MSIESKAVLDYLGTLSEPVDVRTMASAMNIGPEEISDLNGALSILVRMQRVKRHHNQDGILRYSRLPDRSEGKQKKADPDPVPRPVLPPQRSTPRPVAASVLKGSLQEKMFLLLSDTPTYIDVLAARAGFSGRQAPNILQLLKGKSLAVCCQGGLWKRGPAELRIRLKPIKKADAHA